MINRFVQLTNARQIPSRRIVAEAVLAVLKKEKAPIKNDVNIIFVDDREIIKLNRRFFKKNKPTDVIAFNYGESKNGPFGEIYISVTTAKRNARLFKEREKRELIRLIVHGVLHLLGHRDDKNPHKDLMWRKQEEIVSSIFQPPR